MYRAYTEGYGKTYLKLIINSDGTGKLTLIIGKKAEEMELDRGAVEFLAKMFGGDNNEEEDGFK